MSDPVEDAPATDADFARLRRPGLVTYSKRFACPQHHTDHKDRVGTDTRFAYQVVDTHGELTLSGSTNKGYEVLIRETEKRREQIKAVFFEADRHTCILHLQRLSSDGATLSSAFTLKDQEIDLLHSLLDMIPAMNMSEEAGQRIDLSVLERALNTPETWVRVYEEHPQELRELIRDDVTAEDVLAVARRRQQLELFRQMLSDQQKVPSLKAEWGKAGSEAVWQQFFEDNRWIFGLGLSSQLLLAWQTDKLEATVQGFSVSTRGKRADALLRSAGAISGLSFVEIKLPQSQLVENYAHAYRVDSWIPAKELAGGVAQVHATVDAAMATWRGKLEAEDEEGFKEAAAYAIRPRSYLVVGSLSEFLRDGHIAESKFRSFENYRRSLSDPEIITYDELFERAKYVLADAEENVENQRNCLD